LSAVTRKRPNRAHGAIDKLPEEVRRQIIDWYVGKPEQDVQRLTYDEISNELQKLGYRVSKNGVWRWLSRQRTALDRIQEVKARAEVLASRLVPSGATVEAATVHFIEALFMEILVGAEIEQVKTIDDLTRVAQAMGRLQSSAVARDKWEHEKAKRITEAVERLKESVREAVEKDTDLLARLLDLVDEAADAMMEKVE